MSERAFLFSAEKCSLVREAFDASQVRSQDSIADFRAMSASSDSYHFCNWVEVEQVAAMFWGDCAIAWLDHPMQKLEGRSVRQAFHSGDKGPVTELIHQLLAGYVF
ncbi:hypothetical protein GCM10017655_30570 [Pseudomonas turukhanskensis]|uniref:Uncharacterized protein n=1 Tax=Pseudomonas turukhanskensis TaxID=1806536 RepID=A0A9W6NGN1_9PSED|nr:hypothetical protein GCM10017655_30570 [Pseudomonas turukhanskensis]